MKIKSNILVFGLLSTGSSALVDLLREYDNISIIPGEFDDFRAPGLVADQLSLHQSIDFPNKIDQLAPFWKKIRLIYSIAPIFKLKIHSFKGIRGRFKFVRLRIKQLDLLKKLNRKLKTEIAFEDKIRYANNWIQDTSNIQNTELVVYNQPLLTGVDTKIWKEVFYPCKLICVYRDPKDQLADIIKQGRLYLPYGAPYVNIAGVIIETIYGRNRKGAINVHIDAMRKRLEWVDSFRKELDPDKFLLIDFEGLVNNYDTYKSIIENFIGGIKSHHKDRKAYFDPLNAKKSIGIYKEYLTSIELECLTELEIWHKDMIKNNSKFYSKLINDNENKESLV